MGNQHRGGIGQRSGGRSLPPKPHSIPAGPSGSREGDAQGVAVARPGWPKTCKAWDLRRITVSDRCLATSEASEPLAVDAH